MQSTRHVDKILKFSHEGDYTYFMCKQNVQSRRVDLMTYNMMNKLVKNICFAGKYIVVQMEGQCLFFSQFSLMLKQVEPFTRFEQVGGYDSANQEEYYQVSY